MVQVFLIDEDGFYTGEDAWVEEPQKNEITEPYSVGYIRGKWDGEKWVEGAIEEEIQEWLENKDKIDICSEPTAGERIEKLEEEKAILAENVYQLANILEVILGGEESGEEETTTTDTSN